MKYRNLSELHKLEDNPRTIDKDSFDSLCQSIKDNPDYFEARPLILSNRTGKLVILGGNQRYEAAKKLGLEKVPTHLIEGLTEEREEEITIRDNVNNGDWDWDKLANRYDYDKLDEWGVAVPTAVASADSDEVNPQGKLARTFIAPPFSVLDARQGYWRDRKKQWLTLGIKSELGRKGGLVFANLSGCIPDYYMKKTELEKKLGRKLSNEEYERDYLDTEKYQNVGTSIFDPVLAEIAYTWFNVDGGTILDPFAGGSVRGIVASRLGYRYLGHELREDQVEANIAQATEICAGYPEPEYVIGDSSKTVPQSDEQVDLIFTCPPYADLEKYSDDPADISNMDYDDFLRVYRDIIQKSVNRLKENRFAAIVVGDVRDSNGIYHDFVGDTVDAFKDAGMQYYNEIILVTTAGSLPIRAGSTFQKTRKTGKAHQNLLTFYKGDIERIAETFAATREVEDQYVKLLSFYKGDPKRVQQYFEPIDVDQNVDNFDAEE